MVMSRIVAALCAAVVSHAAVGQELGDPVSGAEIFKKECFTCHEIGADAKHKVGPILNEIFDRQAGTAEGFKRYSKGIVRMGVDGLRWDLEHLHIYLDNPKSLVSGTRMSYRGLKDETERADVIAYLRDYSASPANIPEAAPTAMAREVELSPEVLAIVGDADYGEYLSSECGTCHQSDGDDEGIPSITGWPQEDFVVAMHAYKIKMRPHPVMQMLAGRLSDEEIAALAAYYEQLGSE